MSYENMFGLDDLGIEKMRLVGLLEREGMTDETQDFIMKWTKDMETKASISSKEMIRFNVDRSELYEALGEINDMFECLDEALFQVSQEKDSGNEGGNWDELEQKIKARISEMEEKYPA